MKKLLLVLCIFLLILPGTLAAITDVSFYQSGQKMELFGTRVEFDVDLYVTLDTTNNDTELVGDLRALNRKPTLISELQEKEFTCYQNIDNQTNESTETICITDVLLIVSEETVNLTFDITTNISQQENYTFTFSIDDTNPELTAITSEYFINDQYIIASAKPTEIYFDITDSVGSFDLRNVYMKPEHGIKTRLLNCTDNFRCTGLYVGVCSEGTFEEISLANPSTDDAGNMVGGISKQAFRCDAKAPELNKVNEENDVRVYFDNSIYPQPKTGDTITLSLFVKEDASGVNALGNFSNITGQERLQEADCTVTTPGLYNCSWTLTNILHGDNKIYFSVTDGVGRTLQEAGATVEEVEYELHVDYFEKAQGNDTTPMFFKPATAEIPAKQGYNRIAVDLALDSGFEYPLFATYKLERATNGGLIEALHTDVDPYTCILEKDGETVSAKQFFTDITINDPLLAYDLENRINFILSPGADLNDLEDSFEILCNLSVIVRENENVVYEQPTNALLITTMKFRNTALGDEHPGEHFANLIQEKEKRLEGFWKYIGTLNTIAATLTDLCNIDKTLVNYGSSMLGLQMGGIGLQSFAPMKSLGEGMTNTGAKGQYAQRYTNSPTLQQNQKFQLSSLKGIMDTACQLTYCSLDANAKQTNGKDWYWGGDIGVNEFFGDLGNANDEGATGARGMWLDTNEELFENVNVPNPKQSVIAAVQTRCYPALIYHVNQYREIECNALTCMKQQAAAGMDISVCSMTRAQSICQNVVGEAFELPILRQSKNLMDNANAFVQNILPNTLKIVTNNVLCKGVDENYFAKGGEDGSNKISKKAVVFACNLPESIGSQLNMQIKTTSSADAFQYPNGDDVCAVAMCNEDDPSKCVQKAGLISQKLNFDIPGTGLKIQPTVQRYSIADHEALVNQYDKETDKEKKQEILKDMKSLGMLKDPNAKELSQPEIVELKTQIENQKAMAQALNKDPENSKVAFGEDGLLYLTDVDWGRYHIASSEVADLESRLSTKADYKQYTANKKYNELLDARFKEEQKYRSALAEQKVEQNRYKLMTTDPKFQAAYQDYVVHGADGETYNQFKKNNKQFADTFEQLDKTTKNPVDIKEPTYTINDKQLEIAAANAANENPDLKQSLDAGYNRLENAYENRDLSMVEFETSLYQQQQRVKTILASPECQKSSACKEAYAQQEKQLSELQEKMLTEDFATQHTTLTEQAKHEHNLQTSRQTYAKIDQFTDSITSMLMSTGILNYGVLSNYGRDTAFGKISEWSDTYLSSENMIEGMCSSKTKDLSKDADAGGMGGALQCEGGLCMPVLTQAAEKVPFNDTHILYTLVYALGPVQLPDPLANEEPYKYNVVLKTADGLQENNLFQVEWKELPYSIPETYSTSFVGQYNYSEICIRFSHEYPPNEYNSKTMYCRPVIEAKTGNTYFDTGSPVPSDFGDPTNGNAGNVDPTAITEGI